MHFQLQFCMHMMDRICTPVNDPHPREREGEILPDQTGLLHMSSMLNVNKKETFFLQ